MNNFSHGTGTLSILAGAAPAGQPGFGCAPGAEIIPIRVANRVVLFRNSAIAKALDYVHGLCQKQETFVHVVTMSMGGLPSQAWADAINALYELGVFVVTAAGNNYANLPSHYIVYPARFDRVVAACGTTWRGRSTSFGAREPIQTSFPATIARRSIILGPEKRFWIRFIPRTMRKRRLSPQRAKRST